MEPSAAAVRAVCLKKQPCWCGNICVSEKYGWDRKIGHTCNSMHFLLVATLQFD